MSIIGVPGTVIIGVPGTKRRTKPRTKPRTNAKKESIRLNGASIGRDETELEPMWLQTLALDYFKNMDFLPDVVYQIYEWRMLQFLDADRQ